MKARKVPVSRSTRAMGTRVICAKPLHPGLETPCSCLVALPCQVVRTGRQIVHRFLGYSRWLEALFRAHSFFKRLRFA